MRKTGKNKRLLASILAASMLLAMSPFALAEGTEDTTGQEQSTSQSAEVKTEGSGTTGSTGTTTGGTTESGGSTEGGGGTEGVTTEGGGGTEGSGTTEGGGTTEPEKTEAPKNAARIGKTEYASIADALAVAQPGDTIELLKDITESVEVRVTKNFDGELTIDLKHTALMGILLVGVSGEPAAQIVGRKNLL